jgi:hypothetical protein
MNQENGREFGGRLRRDSLIMPLWCDKLAGKTEDARWHARAPQSGVKCEHRSLAEADQR